MSNVHELLEKRWAGRAFSTQPLLEEQLSALIEAARLTPSCFNKQPWRFICVTHADKRAQMVHALSEGNRAWASKAPAILVVTSRASYDCQLPDGREYYQLDTGMAVMNIILAATELGLAARPMAGYDPEKVKETLQLAQEDEVLVLLAIGTPTVEDAFLPERLQGKHEANRERKAKDEIVQFR